MKAGGTAMEWKRGFKGVVLGYALAALGAGCVAVDVGRPEVFTHTETIEETAARPERTEVENIKVQLTQRGERVFIGFQADLREEFRKTRREEITVAKKQKRLAVGLFPGAAEYFHMSKGALTSGALVLSTGTTASQPTPHVLYYGESLPGRGNYILWGVWSVVYCPMLIVWPIGTVQNLLFEPFSGWECSHDFLDGENLKSGIHERGPLHYFDVSGSTKLRQLAKFPEVDRKRLGVHTCFELGQTRHGNPIDQTFQNIGHFGLVGFHKYLAVSVETPVAGRAEEAGVEVRKRQTEVGGPYVVELSIPAVGFKRTSRVESGGSKAVFDLPTAARDGIAEAVVAFRRDAAGGAASEETEGALVKAAGKTYRFDVELKGAAASIPSAHPKPVAAAPAVSPAATERAMAPPVAGRPRAMYEIVGIRRTADGQYEVRVKVADKATTFAVGTAVEPDVKRRIREDYASRHPETGIQYVREIVEWETKEEGAVLVYRGRAFSIRPVQWHYDAHLKKGAVRLRISAGMSAEEAKRWARENISAIVADKNVAVEAGNAPPPGVLYRSLGEKFEKGVLTVWFEALE